MASLDFHTTENTHLFSMDKMLLDAKASNAFLLNTDDSLLNPALENSFFLLEDNKFAEHAEPLECYDDLFNIYFENFHSMKSAPVISEISEYIEHHSNHSIEGLNSYLML
ncbi:MAG: hypothetical protein V4525_04385 [Pseudomonadota bacterium]